MSTAAGPLLQRIRKVAETALTTETEVSLLLLTVLGMEDEDPDIWVPIQELFDIFSDTSREHLRFLCETCLTEGLLDSSDLLQEHYGTHTGRFSSLVALFPTYEELAV